MSNSPLLSEFDSIAALRTALRERRLSARELASSALDAVQSRADLNAFLHIDPALTLAQADEADRRIAQDPASAPLAGIPIAHKDVFVTKGWRSTAASTDPSTQPNPDPQPGPDLQADPIGLDIAGAAQ